MAIRIPWTKYGVALLIDACVRFGSTQSTRNEAIKELSKTLRESAVNNKIEIDDIYRNENGISMKFTIMQAILHDAESGLHNISKLFVEMKDLYYQSNSEYKEILEEAKKMVEIKKSNKEEFAEWLSKKVTPAQLSELYMMYEKVDVFCKQRGLLKKTILETEDFVSVRKILQTVEQNKVFRFIHKRELGRITEAVKYYFEYIKEREKKTSNEAFSHKLDVKQDVSSTKRCNGNTEESNESATRTEQDKRLSLQYPVAYIRVKESLKKSYEVTGDRGVTVNAIYENIKHIVRIDTVALILEGASWAKKNGSRYTYSRDVIIKQNVDVDIKYPEKAMVDNTQKIDEKDRDTYNTLNSSTAIHSSSIGEDTLDSIKYESIIKKMEQIVLRADMNGISYDDLKDTLQITMLLTKQLVAHSNNIVDIKGVLIHEEAFIDWEDGADELETIIEKLMQKNSGYISSTQLFEYVRIEMNMFLNDNDMREERAVFDMAQHLFEKVHYHGKSYTFRGKMHISRADTGIGSNMDVYKKYATDQGGAFSFNGLVEYLESIGVGSGNLRAQMRMQNEPIFFFYDHDLVVYAEMLHIDDAWKKSMKKSLNMLFDDVGDHMILRDIPAIWFDRLPAISGNCHWTPLLLQSVLRFYSKELGARTIQALDGQALETVHTMLVVNDSPIQNFGDVVISYLLEQNIVRRNFEAEELRQLLVDGGILHGNELIWNMPKALKYDGRFAWDASVNQVTIKI